MFPDRVNVYFPIFDLGKAKLKLHDNAEAVRYLQQAAEMNDDEASVFYLLATALRASGRDQEARVALRRVSGVAYYVSRSRPAHARCHGCRSTLACAD